MLNINREIEDPFYRYKMPKLVAKVEGKGNGIKTVVFNMTEIATALDRPPTYCTKYFGCELGAQTQFQIEAERYIVNGAHEAGRLQDLLDGFIKKYVLCQNCHNPETDLRITSKKVIEQSCKACGHRTTGIAPTHRLTTYIINNPPESKPRGDKKHRVKDKKDESASAGAAAAAAPSVLAPASASVRDNAAQRANGVIDAPKDVGTVNADELEWSVDTSAEAVRERASDLGAAVGALTMTEDLERSSKDRLALFDTFVAARVNLPAFPAKEVIGEAERLSCKEKGVMVLADRLWVGDVVAKIKVFQALFQRFTLDNPKAQRNLLHSLEAIVSKNAAVLPRVPHILKALYELDIVEEEAIFEWAEKPAKIASEELFKEILQKADPILQWLREAESDDDDDEDGEDGEEDDDDDEHAVQVAFSSTAEPGMAVTTAPAATAAAAADDDDDLDIDNI